MAELLEDHLRRATRNFTARLAEEQVFRLGRDLALELARAHAETPPRFPALDPAAISMEDGRPRVTGGEARGRPTEGLLELRALLHWLSTGEKPDVSWRLDGPPSAEVSTLRRRAVLRTLAAPSGQGYETAVQH